MKTRKILFYCLAALLGGCVPVLSLQPLFTSQTLVFEEQLLGTWIDDANDQDISWQFARLESGAAEKLPDELKGLSEKVYRLNLRDKEDRKGMFLAILVKLDGKLFLDVFADTFPSGEDNVENMELFYNAFLFVRAHTFIRVDMADAKLRLRLTNDDKLQTLLDAEPNAVSSVAADDRIILTASTPALQTFVTKYADDERVFADEVVLERKSP
jgi:hypothetical protein